jgi:hypothetical protein
MARARKSQGTDHKGDWEETFAHGQSQLFLKVYPKIGDDGQSRGENGVHQGGGRRLKTSNHDRQDRSFLSAMNSRHQKIDKIRNIGPGL